MTAMLAPILESTRRRLAALEGREEELRARAGHRSPARPFAGALGGEDLAVIAEIKRRSPSAGRIASDLDPGRRARAYRQGGAAALSVLTEPDHFSGSLEDLARAREASGLPVLRKDFVLAPVQVWEARAADADAVLLIAAVLSEGELTGLLEASREAGVDALVEVHSEEEAERALVAGAELVGVNNRDLRTFEVDLATAERLAPLLEAVEVRVAESGIEDPEDARRMADAGYDAVLVGEALVRSRDPAGFLRALRHPVVPGVSP